MIYMNGDFFFSVPGVCGDFRDLLGTGKWGMTARGQVRMVYNLGFGSGLFALRSALILEGEAKLLVSLGGSSRFVCGTGDDPSGVFLKVDVRAGTSIAEGTLLSNILGIFSPSTAISVDAYAMVRQDTRLLPGYIKQEFIEGVENTIALLSDLVLWLQAISTKVTSELIEGSQEFVRDINALIRDCSGSPACWMSSPELAAAANALKSIASTLQSVSSAISTLSFRVNSIIASVNAVIKQLQDNVQLAMQVLLSSVIAEFASLFVCSMFFSRDFNYYCLSLTDTCFAIHFQPAWHWFPRRCPILSV